MSYLRQYTEQDAEVILSWIRDEVTFRKWSANIFNNYPISDTELDEFYRNPVKMMEYGLIPMMFCDEEEIVGHMFFRPLDADKRTIRFGFVIIDDSKRGKGYGREMLRLAEAYATEKYNTEKFTLGVFENNLNAHSCYRAAGFSDSGHESYEIMGEQWSCIEMEKTCRQPK